MRIRYYAVLLAYARRPITFDDPEHEIVYSRHFVSLGVSRLEFKQLVAFALVRNVREGTVLIEKGNEVTSLSIVTSGLLSVFDSGAAVAGAGPALAGGEGADDDVHQDLLLNEIGPGEFVEGPEWATRECVGAAVL